jgi:small subunit ribosomal protein S27e
MAQDFLRVECEECGNQQTIFSRAASEVECLVCSTVIADPKGGKPELNGKVVETLSPE